jgi:hypothetical protein
MLAYLYHSYLSALDSNDTECTEEEEVFEYQGEDQGQADQGKPSELVASLILVYLLHVLSTFMQMHVFMLLLPLDSNYWRLGSTSQLLSSSWMTPLNTYLSSGLLA